MLDRDKIIERIEKLLAMTEDAGCTPEEAVAFALKAQRLIAEYDISEDEIGQNERQPPVEVDAMPTYRAWRALLADAIAENFRCKWFFRTELRERKWGARRSGSDTYIVFFGYKADATAAALTFNHLYKCGCATAVDPRSGRKYKGIEYRTYTAGFVEGVRSELEKQSQALMLVVPAEVKESYEVLQKGFKGSRSLGDYYTVANGNARERGFDAGKEAVRKSRFDSTDDPAPLPPQTCQLPSAY